MKEYRDLPGVRVMDLNLFPDERGYFQELFRIDWKELLGDDQVVQSNMSYTYPGMIRAWHRHIRGQVDYFRVLHGSLKICAYSDDPDHRHLVEIIASSQRPQLIRIPGFYWHGFKNIHNEPSTLVYYVTRLYDPRDPDEERRPWNDPAILDNNGVTFDWNRPPHK